MITAVSDAEIATLQNIVPRKPIYPLKAFFDMQPASNVGVEGRSGILFLGAFSNAMYYNGDALAYFVKEILPFISQDINLVMRTLTAVGSNPPEALLKTIGNRRDVHMLGFVPELDHIFTTSRVIVMPHQYAAGQAMKALTAGSYALPMVVSPIVAKGIAPADDHGILVCDTPKSFAKAVSRLLVDDDFWREQHQGLFRFQKQFNRVNFEKSISDLTAIIPETSCGSQ